MGFSGVDYIIVAAYLIGVTIAGVIISGKQRTSRDYFLGGKKLPWWSVGFSIVASETSTLTFISVPGLGFATNMHFLQVAVGYFFGRLLVSVLFIPAYYSGDLETAYDFIGKRFGLGLRKFTSSVFIVTRVLASGVRLFATAIPVHLITGLNYPASILLVGSFTFLYTYIGGLKAVVAMDVVQLFIYIAGAGVSMYLIIHRLPNGWQDVFTFASAAGVSKFEIINTHYGNSLVEFLAAPYTLIGGLLGGTFLTMASHGTDQLLVQRLLGCRSKRESQQALMLDAGLIVLQFGFFLVLGICLYAFYHGVTFQQLGLKSSDEVFPKFILEELPSGISGLLISGVLASAMGSLSSSISSLASSSYLDLFKLSKQGRGLNEQKEIIWSRLFTLFWGVVLIGGAMLFADTKNPVVEIGLKITSFTYGGLLGTFFLGLMFKRTNQIDAFLGFVAGLLTMIVIISCTEVNFLWHTLIGCTASIVTANVSAGIRTLFVRRIDGT
jgi:SSS family transporter